MILAAQDPRWSISPDEERFFLYTTAPTLDPTAAQLGCTGQLCLAYSRKGSPRAPASHDSADHDRLGRG